MAYLDENGLSKVWEKVKGLTSSSGSGGSTILYDNSSGTSGTITLAQPANDFNFLVVRINFINSNRYLYRSWNIIANSGSTSIPLYGNNASNLTTNYFEQIKVTAKSLTLPELSKGYAMVYEVIGV